MKVYIHLDNIPILKGIFYCPKCACRFDIEEHIPKNEISTVEHICYVCKTEHQIRITN